MRQSYNNGNSVTVELDASGAPVSYTRSDGKKRSAIRDSAGRVIKEIDFDGGVKTASYDARGALTDYKTSSRQLHFEYDHQGRLSAIVDGGVRETVERDGQGNIQRLRVSGSAKLRFAHAQELVPPPDCCGGEIITTDVWAPFWNANSGWYQKWSDGVYQIQVNAGNETPPGVPPPDSLNCAKGLSECGFAIIGYPALILALDAACPETFGITCLIALIALPLGGITAAFMRSCYS